MRKDGRPRILDAYCGAGGAAEGLRRAGFYVIGVDNKPQPDYCGDAFFRGDAVKFIRKNRRKFDAVWASPPCQAFSLLTLGNRAKGQYDAHVNLIPATRRALELSNKPWVMENVPKAPLRKDLELCGFMFELSLFRHRIFELSGFSVDQLSHIPHGDRRVRAWRHGKVQEGDVYGVYGNGGLKGSLEEWQRAMGIFHTSNMHSLAEAVPPAYSEYIGRYLMKQLKS